MPFDDKQCAFRGYSRHIHGKDPFWCVGTTVPVKPFEESGTLPLRVLCLAAIHQPAKVRMPPRVCLFLLPLSATTATSSRASSRPSSSSRPQSSKSRPPSSSTSKSRPNTRGGSQQPIKPGSALRPVSGRKASPTSRHSSQGNTTNPQRFQRGNQTRN